jgi:LasA protease
MKRRLLLAVLLLWLLPALACNLPQQPDPVVLTLASRPSATPARLDGEAHSFPGSVPTVRSIAVPAQPAASEREAWSFPSLVILKDFTANAVTADLVEVNPGGGTLIYTAQPGDTPAGLAKRFAVPPGDVHIASEGLLPAGTKVEISFPTAWTLPGFALLPDSEIVYGPSAADFSTETYVKDAGGYLNSYSEVVNGHTLSGAQIVQRVAIEMSVNPRILLAFLEFRSGWVLGSPKAGVKDAYPIGFEADGYRGLYKELVLVARQLSVGYYFWRSGSLGTLEFPEGGLARLNPTINAGTAAVSLLVSKLYPLSEYAPTLYGAKGFVSFYTWLFGDPWLRAAAVEPQIPNDLMAELPPLELPFAPGDAWKFTGGPHPAWGTGSPDGAVDFAPFKDGRGCAVSANWATAAAAGVVTVSEDGMLLLALDPGGKAEKGWALLYLHLAEAGRAAVGTHVQTGDHLGHPSCEGGVATGTNLHIARKFNGEWIGSGPETPFNLGRWHAVPGKTPYEGSLVRDDGLSMNARSDGSRGSEIPH